MGKRKRNKHKRLFPIRYGAEYVKTDRFDHVKAMEYNSQRSKVTRGPRENASHVPSRFNPFVEPVPRTRSLLSREVSKDGNKVFVKSERAAVVDRLHNMWQAEELQVYGFISGKGGHNVIQYSRIIIERTERKQVLIFFAGREFILVIDFGDGEKLTRRYISKTYTSLGDVLGAYRCNTIVWRSVHG